MDFDEINPAAAVLSLIGGIAGFIMAKGMYPVGGIKGFLITFMTFIGTTAICYALVSRMATR